MIDYLGNTLGLSARELEWEDQARLPRYLRGGRRYSVLQLEGTSLLVVRMAESAFSIQAFRKQQDKLAEYWPGEIVLCFDRLSSYQRKALI